MIKTNINEFIGRMQKRGTLSVKSERDTPNEAHSAFIVLAKNKAPRKTGETIENIRGLIVSKKHFRVISTVNGPFKHNMWTNKTEPYARPRMFWNDGRSTIYGDGSHRTTGIPGWFTKSAVEVADKYKSIALKHVSKSLNVR